VSYRRGYGKQRTNFSKDTLDVQLQVFTEFDIWRCGVPLTESLVLEYLGPSDPIFVTQSRMIHSSMLMSMFPPSSCTESLRMKSAQFPAQMPDNSTFETKQAFLNLSLLMAIALKQVIQ